MTAFVYDDIELIFIHIPKTGGTSITDCLVGLDFVNQQAIEEHGLTDHRKLEYIKDGHITTTELRKKIGDDKYNNFFSFAVMREPYDWLLSMFGYACDTSGSLLNFENFIDGFNEAGNNLQSYWFTTSGIIDVDHIASFSNLENELNKIITHIENNCSNYTALNSVVPIEIFIHDLRQRFPLKKINETRHKMGTDAYEDKKVIKKATNLIEKDLELYEGLFGVRREFI
jgi:hypothetical protein